MRTAIDLPDAIDSAKNGQESMVKCPSHPDNQASLHVAPGTSQAVAMFCHAGCTVDQILAAQGLTFADISKPLDPAETRAEDMWTPAGTATHAYPYRDERGTVLYHVMRVPQPDGSKTFRQCHWGPDGKRVWNMEGVRRVLYRLPEIIAAKDRGETVYVVEGEKDADTMVRLGFQATTSPMGAGKWRDEYGVMLGGAKVVIFADADSTGRAHARMARDNLMVNGCEVSIMEAPQPYKDVSALVMSGGKVADMVETVPAIVQERASYGVDILEVIERTVPITEFVIPNVLAKGDRLLVTGFEGTGKSQFLRQLAAQVAAGIHPFTGMDMDPKKVLYLDAENHPNQTVQSWQDLVGLSHRHLHGIERDALTLLEEWDTEVDLISPDGRAWLMERIHAYRPDLVCMGPLYNLVGRDLKDDETVRRLKTVVNEARAICGTAFVMEHHAPHKGPMDKERSLRPYGSSILMRWPDFGYGIKPTETEGVFEWQKIRWPRVRARVWPEYLRWGKPNTAEWPWMVTELDDNGAAMY